jgi:hypothetical protein
LKLRSPWVDPELAIEVECTGLMVPEELLLNGKPGLSDGAVVLADDF